MPQIWEADDVQGDPDAMFTRLTREHASDSSNLLRQFGQVNDAGEIIKSPRFSSRLLGVNWKETGPSEPKLSLADRQSLDAFRAAAIRHGRLDEEEPHLALVKDRIEQSLSGTKEHKFMSNEPTIRSGDQTLHLSELGDYNTHGALAVVAITLPALKQTMVGTSEQFTIGASCASISLIMDGLSEAERLGSNVTVPTGFFDDSDGEPELESGLEPASSAPAPPKPVARTISMVPDDPKRAAPDGDANAAKKKRAKKAKAEA